MLSDEILPELYTLFATIAVSLIFLWLYTPQELINYGLSLLHISVPDCLEVPVSALPTIMILNILDDRSYLHDFLPGCCVCWLKGINCHYQIQEGTTNIGVCRTTFAAPAKHRSQ
jgi:hypothetical protein